MTVNVNIHDPEPSVSTLNGGSVLVNIPLRPGIESALSYVSLYLTPEAARSFGESLMREAYRGEQLEKLKVQLPTVPPNRELTGI